VSVPGRDGGTTSLTPTDAVADLRTLSGGDLTERTRELAWVYNQDLPFLPLTEQRDQSFVDGDGISVPAEGAEAYQTRWPNTWLVKTGRIAPPSGSQPTQTPEPTETPEPTAHPTPTPRSTPTPESTDTATPPPKRPTAEPTATPTPAPTDPPTATQAPPTATTEASTTDDDSGGGADDGGDGGGLTVGTGDGFGVVAALAGLTGAGLLRRRRQDE
jgi:PGF-CTERM protein